MPDHADIACRLLRFEQQLKAYETLHADELAELWRTLNECKQRVARLSETAPSGPLPTPTNPQADGEAIAPSAPHQGGSAHASA